VVVATVVIGWGNGQQRSALRQILSTHDRASIVRSWPTDRVVTFAARSLAAAAVIEGPLSSTSLRAINDASDVNSGLGVVVVGPVVPTQDVLVALSAGVAGYLAAPSAPPMVGSAVEAVLAGELVIPREVSLPLVEHLRTGGRGITVTRSDGTAVELTGREWQVYVWLRQARTTTEIAQRLVISAATVRTHVAALVHKLNVADRNALGRVAFDHQPNGRPSTASMRPAPATPVPSSPDR
jgi:DNA-binding NarL/FixJ family response regulator